MSRLLGKGFDFVTHIGLPKEERNVTIYLHTACENKVNDSIDSYIYRLVEEKANLIGVLKHY